jgi:hypothetical protein
MTFIETSMVGTQDRRNFVDVRELHFFIGMDIYVYG